MSQEMMIESSYNSGTIVEEPLEHKESLNRINSAPDAHKGFVEVDEATFTRYTNDKEKEQSLSVLFGR